MSNKKNPQQIVEQCEALLKEHNMAGIIVAMDDDDGFYGLTLQNTSVFQWSPDESKVRLTEATQEQLEAEANSLHTLDTMLNFCQRALVALGSLLNESLNPEPSEPNGGRDKRYVN